MNKLRAFVHGQVASRPASDPPPPLNPGNDRPGKLILVNGELVELAGKRRHTRDDARAKRKRTARRRARKGYK